jgi:DNA-binding Xre family transcriptional regulator
MIKRRPKKSTRTLTQAEREGIHVVRKQVESERAEIVSRARELKKARQSAVAQLQEAFALLRSERQSRGISLAELRDRTGIGRSALSRLENDPEANPTITTLARIAEALGKQIVIQLVEKPKS